MTGEDFGYNYPDLVEIDCDNDNDDDKEVETTRPSELAAASTPYQYSEQIEMQRMQPETSYEEPPLFGDFLHLEDKQTNSLYQGKVSESELREITPNRFKQKGCTNRYCFVWQKRG